MVTEKVKVTGAELFLPAYGGLYGKKETLGALRIKNLACRKLE